MADRDADIAAGTQGVFLRPGEGLSVQNPVGGPLVLKVRGQDTAGALTALESTAAPGEGPPLHVHANEDELILVLAGTFRFRLEDQIHEAPAGALMLVPRGARHTWQNIGAEPGRLFVVFTPSGMEGFFERFSEHAGSDSAKVAFRRLGEDVGMDVVGPPLADSDPVEPGPSAGR